MIGETFDAMAQSIRDHRLQPRWRSGDAAPAEDYECLCGGMFWGVAEWSYHVVDALTPPTTQPRTPAGSTEGATS